MRRMDGVMMCIHAGKHKTVSTKALFEPRRNARNGARAQCRFALDGCIRRARIKHACDLPTLRNIGDFVSGQKVTKELLCFRSILEGKNCLPKRSLLRRRGRHTAPLYHSKVFCQASTVSPLPYLMCYPDYTMIDRRTFLETTIRAAGQILRDHFGHVTAERAKDGDPHSIVTAADIASNDYITTQIRQHFPDDMIVSEEDEASHGNAMADRVWIIDPLDGTRNFASRVPLFGVLIAYAEKGEVVLSSIYLPMTDELAIAEKGNGAVINGCVPVLSSQTDFASSYGIGQIRPGKEKTLAFARAIQETYGEKGPWVNGIACVAVTGLYLADGRRDWYVSRGSKVWDYAAPMLLMKEAGCITTNDQGESWKLSDTSAVVATPALHAELLRLVQ